MENMASYSALGEYGLWKNLKFGEAKPSRISNFFITHILQVQIVNAIFSTRSFDIRFHWVLTGFLKVEVKEVEQVTFPAQETFD